MTNDKAGLGYNIGASTSNAEGKVAFIKPISNDFMPFKTNGGNTLIKKTTDASMLVMPKNKKPTPTTAKKQGAFFGKTTTKRGEREWNPASGKGRKDKTRFVMTSFEARLAKVELAVVDGQDNFEELSQSIEGLEGEGAELRGEMQAAFNYVVEELRKYIDSKYDLIHAELAVIREEMKEMKGKVSLCKAVVAQGTFSSIIAPKVDVPRPKSFHGSRNARDLDNFLWNLEQYFNAMSIEDDAKNIKTAPLYLADVVMLSWRRRHVDIGKGTCTMESWDDFKREIKRQFYLENSKHEAHAKLHWLSHKNTIREYVKEFSELMLEIPDMLDKKALFTFVDGLQP
ncbi:hypothetical protein Acr_00g0047900 [Actinidia rufa]|uniref:Retrotransposon gag domain-containing protein n=1 Tax=Actinidia rufa TaxID=165716 RepID=A0A7J0DK02_9ERIC|nr:hypothetical protein Acr_00g0047900 [Actinidia rufa]